MVRLFAAVLALVAFSAHGQSVTLEWEPPSQFTNGDVLNPATDLSGYGVYVDGARVATASNTVTSYQVTGLSYGPHDFWVTAIANNGNESAMSNTVARTIVDNRTPRPPRLIDVILAWLRSIFGRFA